MMKKMDKKKDTLASRARAKAMDTMMKAPARKPPAAMATPSGLASMQPPGADQMAMKKGGKVDFSKIVRNTKTGKLSEKLGMKHGGKVPPKKGGLMIMIAMGKKKGK
jgi:hypothetical protein